MTLSRRRWLHGERERAARGRWVPAGFGIFARNQLARWFGVAVAAVNLIAALTSIEAYPFWALVIVGIDVLVSYGLAAYGDRLERPAGLSHEPHTPDLTQAIVVGPRSMGRHCRVGDEQARWSKPLVPDETAVSGEGLNPASGARDKTTGTPPCPLRKPGRASPSAGNTAILHSGGADDVLPARRVCRRG